MTALAVTGGSALAGPIDVSKLPPPAAKADVTYAVDIRPLFEASCVRCHGADRPKAGLHLDSLEGALRGSKEGKVITPGSSEKSLLVVAASRLDPKTAMPPEPRPNRRGGPGGPGGSGTNAPAGAGGGPRGPMGPPPKPLTGEQVGLVRAWIDQGAK